MQLFGNRFATPVLFESTLEPWSDLRREIDRAFDSALQGRPVGFNGEPRWTPPMDLEEHDDVIRLNVELPGVNPKDVSITVDNGLLTIAGEKKVEAVRSAEEYDGVRMYECRYGRFERRLTLPQYVDADKVSAHYNNGVLKLVLPKLAQSRRKTIEIGTSEERPRQLETGDRSRKTT